MDSKEYQELLDAAQKVCEGIERLNPGLKHNKRVQQANKVYQYIGGHPLNYAPDCPEGGKCSGHPACCLKYMGDKDV